MGCGRLKGFTGPRRETKINYPFIYLPQFRINILRNNIICTVDSLKSKKRESKRRKKYIKTNKLKFIGSL
jgi:hypothetical protein